MILRTLSVSVSVLVIGCSPAANGTGGGGSPVDVAAGMTDALTIDAAQLDVASPADVTSLPLEGFEAPELLGRPTASSISVSLLPSSAMELYVEFGKSAAQLDQQTAASTREALKPAVVEITGLTADQGYSYRVRWRKPGEAAYQSGPVRSFRTQRQAGQTFRFTVQADSHMDENSSLDQYHRTLGNVLADAPDFHIDLGDTFMCEKHSEPLSATVQMAADQATVTKRYLYERDHFGLIAHSVPLFLANGNHEGEWGYFVTPGGADIATWATQARQAYYLPPTPNQFYSGDTQTYANVGERGAWYAWQWGDALFVVLDPYWHTTVKTNKEPWQLTLGKPQYDWLTSTLAGSKAKWKFVFLHNLVGGLDGQMRGGIEAAPYFEWGGANADGSPGFAQKRPGWAKPIHQLLVAHKVTAVFHGHDHLYAHQSLDGVVYQEVPQPSAKNTQNGAQLAASYHYAAGTTLGSAGHLRVTVSGTEVKGEYVRSWLPSAEKGTQKNGDIAHSWSVTAP